MSRATVSAAGALAAAAWLLRDEGAWDTYRLPLFWPFISAAVMMAAFSTTEMANERRDWRTLVVRAAVIGGAVEAIAALVVARNPIYDLHPRDVGMLAVAAALTIVAAGAATDVAAQQTSRAWVRAAWCVAATMVVLTLVPRALLALH